MVRSKLLFVFLVSTLTAVAASPSDADRLWEFRMLVGKWSCSGRFLHSGKNIQSQLLFEDALEGKWLVMHHDDVPPFTYQAMYEWGCDGKGGKYVMAVQDSSGTLRVFSSKGWEGAELVWETNGQTPSQRFTYLKTGPRRIQISYAVDHEGKWDTIDVINCTPAPE